MLRPVNVASTNDVVVDENDIDADDVHDMFAFGVAIRVALPAWMLVIELYVSQGCLVGPIFLLLDRWDETGWDAAIVPGDDKEKSLSWVGVVDDAPQQ